MNSAALCPEHHEGVARIRIQRLPDHHSGLRIRINVLEAREPDADVDVARDLLIREPKFVGGAPDVGSAASDRPRARRDGGAPHYSRTANVPGRPTCRQRGLRAHQTGADGQRAYQSHGGQSSAPNLFCRQNASPGYLSRASTQRASRQCWPNGRVAFHHSTTLICELAGRLRWQERCHLDISVKTFNIYRGSIQSSSALKPAGTGFDTSNNYTNGGGLRK